MSLQETSVKMTSKEAADRVSELPNDNSNQSEVSGYSRRSSTSKRSLTKSHQSVKSESLSLRKAALKARQSFEEHQLQLLQQEDEDEQAYQQHRRALQRLQDDAERDYKQKQKVRAVQRASLATKQELAEIDAVMEASGNCSEPDEEISFKELRQEKKSEQMKRYFDSQVKTVTTPSQQDVTPLLNGNVVEEGSGRIATSSEENLTSLVLREHYDRQDTCNQTSDVVVTAKCKHEGSIEDSRDIEVFHHLHPSPIRNEMPNVRSKIQRSEVVRELSDLKPAAEQKMTSCSAEVDMFMLTEEKCSSAIPQVAPSEVVAEAEDNSNVQRPIIRSGVISKLFKSSGDGHLASCKTTAVQRNVIEASWAEVDVAENVTVPSKMHWQSHGQNERRKRKRWRFGEHAEDQGIPDQGASKYNTRIICDIVGFMRYS